MNIVTAIEMAELKRERVGKHFFCKAAPLRRQIQKNSSFNM